MKRWKVVAAGATIALTAAACGSSGGGSGGSTTGASAGPKLTGSTITIGVQSPENGAAAYPQSTYGATAAEHYINNTLGGINGHPVKLDVCAGDGTPETAISCANGFVSKNVPVVFDAYDGSSIGPMAPVLKSAKIPIVGLLAGQGIAESEPYGSAFYFSGPLETSALGSMVILQKLGKKKASLAVTDAPAAHSYVDDLIVPIAKKLGLTVGAVYTSATNQNYSVLAATELSGKPDVAGVIALPEPGCTGLIQALRTQGYTGTIFAGSCSQFISTVGAAAAGAVVQPRLWVPLSKANAPADVQTELNTFATEMTATGHKGEQSARSEYSFAGIVNLAKILDGVKGDITNATVTTAMEGVKDFQTFAGPKVTCDGKQWPGRPGACSHAGIFFEVQKDGSLKSVDAGGFISLDTSISAG